MSVLTINWLTVIVYFYIHHFLSYYLRVKKKTAFLKFKELISGRFPPPLPKIGFWLWKSQKPFPKLAATFRSFPSWHLQMRCGCCSGCFTKQD
jgi:hypothetical protein